MSYFRKVTQDHRVPEISRKHPGNPLDGGKI